MSDENSNKKFDNFVTILIASVAIWVAITAFFQNYAANISDQARRRAQQYAIESTKKEVSGVIQFSYDWQAAYQSWRELSWQITAAEQRGDTQAADRYRALQETIIPLSKMLGPQYFDPQVGFPDTYKYQAESYLVEATRLSETYLAESELGNFTDNTADALIVQITLLTVSLSLYGLSLALSGRVRWLFVIVGSGIVGFCMLWLSWSLIEIIGRPEVNSAAINAYAEGVGLSYQGRYENAIEKFNQAIAENKYYAKAYYERGLAYYSLNDYTTAIAQMEEARQRGLDDTNLNWNLGWIYYLDGQYNKAIETNERILASNPQVLGMRMNQALTYLAMGDLGNSQAQYDLLYQEAQKQVNDARQQGAEPSASLWYYMDAGALDLQNLIDQLDDNPKSWTQAPAPERIQGDHDTIRDFAYQQMKRMKETTIALEYTGQLPAAQSVSQVDSVTIGKVTGSDADGFITGFEASINDVIPYGEKSFSVEFTYSGEPTNELIWRVYVNGYEDHAMRTVSNEDLSAGNTWYRTFGFEYTNVFILSAGEYVVELYADNVLILRKTFYVQ
ncbi:MAG: tetratricopeptide repeat protein [Chloroflexi bacterium]|nr:tetratricopeptide repeat protein [Chloroflexota bacterium]